jgi:uncharacterized DUF497 family protein
MVYELVEFEWDLKKELDNAKKHGVSFSEAAESFQDPKGFSMEDSKHSTAEPRHYWIGRSSSGKILTVRYTRRGSKIRIFGAAEWRVFRELYNEKAKNKRSKN